MSKTYSYKDFYLVPQYSELKSRSLASVTAKLGGREFKLPVVPSNMKGSINESLAYQLSEAGYFYIMHRFFPEGSGGAFGFCCDAEEAKWKTISISIGVKNEDRILVENLAGSFGHIGCEDPTRVDFITIDIAHGHCLAMKNMIQHIKAMFSNLRVKVPFVIAGNVTTPHAVADLVRWGADAVKIGIGGGGVCSTKNKTGFHVPMATAVAMCSKWKQYVSETLPRNNLKAIEELAALPIVPIIADGGVRENADYAKAIALGADFVMAGGVFAACTDSPAENIKKEGDNRVYKRFFGSASAQNKGMRKHVEGFEVDLRCNGMTYAEYLEEIEQDLKSAVSYAGGVDLSVIKKAETIFA